MYQTTDKIIDLFKQGLHHAEICRITGASAYVVTRIGKRNGFAGAKGGCQPKPIPDGLIDALRAGMPRKQAMEQFNTTEAVIRRAFRDHNIPKSNLAKKAEERSQAQKERLCRVRKLPIDVMREIGYTADEWSQYTAQFVKRGKAA